MRLIRGFTHLNGTRITSHKLTINGIRNGLEHPNHLATFWIILDEDEDSAVIDIN